MTLRRSSRTDSFQVQTSKDTAIIHLIGSLKPNAGNSKQAFYDYLYELLNQK